MVITEEEVKKIIEIDSTIEEFSSVSSDGRALLTRIPKNIVDEIKIKKGNSLKWIVDLKSREIKIQIINDDKVSTKKN